MECIIESYGGRQIENLKKWVESKMSRKKRRE